jgi:predicted heme/steroid binding protein
MQKNISPKKEFNQSKNLVKASYLLVTALTLLAWNARFSGNLKGFSIPSLLALLAFGYMWVHYLTSYLKSNYEPNLKTELSLKATQLFVFLAIVVHPVAIVSYLRKTGYGNPPGSFDLAFGETGAFFISLGTISLLAFLAFEFKKVLIKRPKIWSGVLKLNDLAMLLIVVHGFKLGIVLASGWFRLVWLAYGLSLLYFFYDKYVKKEQVKKFTELLIVALSVMGLGFISLAYSGPSRADNNNSSESSEQQENEDEEGWISASQLSRNDGLEGRDCWFAVDGDVYDATGNPQWQNGEHTPSRGQAKCGQDLTEALTSSPHGERVLFQLDVVGQLR